jgi:hypothetical protein
MDSNVVTIQVDDPHRLIRVSLPRELTDVGLINVFALLRAMQEFANGYSLLFDGTDVQHTELTGDGVYNLARSTEGDLNRVAIVASTPVAFGMARMYEICSNWKEERVSVFSDKESALAWLSAAR